MWLYPIFWGFEPSFYYNIASKLTKTVNVNNTRSQIPEKSQIDCLHSTYHTKIYFTPSDVTKYLGMISNSKATGRDDISIRMLKSTYLISLFPFLLTYSIELLLMAFFLRLGNLRESHQFSKAEIRTFLSTSNLFMYYQSFPRFLKDINIHLNSYLTRVKYPHKLQSWL